MALFVGILFCLLALTCSGQSTNQHMICKTVDDVFNEVTGTGVARRRNIGPAGKPGLPGIRGERGLQGAKGQSGEVDYERLEELVRARVREETRHLELKVNEQEAKIQNMTQTIPENRDLELEDNEMNAKTQNMTISAMCDGVIYDGRCYWAEVHSVNDITNAEAQEICRNRGSRLADIYSKDHYKMVMRFLKSKLNGRSWIVVWTGMKKIYGNRSAQLSDNTQAPYTKARSNSPSWNTASRDYTHVYLRVHESDTDPDQGMSAGHPNWSMYGALCQSQ